MAITTRDQLLAGMQPPWSFVKAVSGTLVAGRPFTPLYTAGFPGAAVAPTPGLSGAALTSYAGQLPWANPAAGWAYLARFEAMATQAGRLMLCDRLWHNSGITITQTTAHTINSVTLPARDRTGTTDGVDVQVGVEVSAATGAGTPTLTVGYTNSANGNSRTGTNAIATSASSPIGTFYPIGLQAGDVGVRSIQSFTLSATWTSGTIHLVAYRVLASLSLTQANVSSAVDALTAGMPRAYNDTVPFLLFIPNTTTSSNISGQVVWAHG